jgi:hypothetical protein
MAAAKPVSLSVRPLQVSHLCFEIDGILGMSNTALGAAVTAFDFDGFYATLNAFPTGTNDPSRLRYNYADIQAYVSPFALAALRAEAGKVALNKAINARQNAYYAKYQNRNAIIAEIDKFYSPSQNDSKPKRLERLSQIADKQASALQSAYQHDNMTGVVRTTKSTLHSKTTTKGGSTEIGESNQVSMYQGLTVPGTPPPPPAGIPLNETAYTDNTYDEGNNLENTTSKGSATEDQTIYNRDYAYRVPYRECEAQNERAQISLMDQQFAQFMYGQNLPNLKEVFRNELDSIDSDVFRLQTAFLGTILMSPIAGTITGIYKNPGDAVKAGEPVFRVENSAEILLEGTLVYRGPIPMGSLLTIQTTPFDAAASPGASPLTRLATVVAVRGADADDRWEIVARSDNLDNNGNPIFPLGYQFDYDNTTVLVN